MEFNKELRNLLANKLKEVKQLNDAFLDLDNRITEESGHIDILDRIARIDTLKARLVNKVERIRQEERSSEVAFSNIKLFSGVLGFFAGSMIGKISKQESPFALGGRLFIQELGKKSPFGTVMMALKDERKIEEIEIIAISRLARESKTTDAGTISSLKSQGFSLMTPEEFWETLDHFKETIKEGKS